MSIEEFEDYTRKTMEESSHRLLFPKLDIYQVLMAFYEKKTKYWIFTFEDDLVISSCPLCGARKAAKFKRRRATLWPFVMNIDKSLFMCHVCECRGDAYSLIVEAMNCTQREASELGKPFIQEDEDASIN